MRKKTVKMTKMRKMKRKTASNLCFKIDPKKAVP